MDKLYKVGFTISGSSPVDRSITHLVLVRGIPEDGEIDMAKFHLEMQKGLAIEHPADVVRVRSITPAEAHGAIEYSSIAARSPEEISETETRIIEHLATLFPDVDVSVSSNGVLSAGKLTMSQDAFLQMQETLSR